MKKPELLVPASSLEVLKVAVIFGADAVYIGGEAFGLRAKAKNFSLEEMAEGIRFAHERGAKVYVTANILAHNEDLEGVREYFLELRKIGPDALSSQIPVFFRSPQRCVLRLSAISVRRRIIQIMARIVSGMSRGQAGW